MLSLETELRLTNLIKAIAKGESEVEIRRQILAEKPLFEPYAAFRRLDQTQKGAIDSSDIRQFLRYFPIISIIFIKV